jgi:hypothetical protein
MVIVFGPLACLLYKHLSFVSGEKLLKSTGIERYLRSIHDQPPLGGLTTQMYYSWVGKSALGRLFCHAS